MLKETNFDPVQTRALFQTSSSIASLCHLHTLPWKGQMWKNLGRCEISYPKAICLYFFFLNWVQISKFSLKTSDNGFGGGRRNLMHLLAQLQPLYHGLEVEKLKCSLNQRDWRRGKTPNMQRNGGTFINISSQPHLRTIEKGIRISFHG